MDINKALVSHIFSHRNFLDSANCSSRRLSLRYGNNRNTFLGYFVRQNAPNSLSVQELSSAFLLSCLVHTFRARPFSSARQLFAISQRIRPLRYISAKLRIGRHTHTLLVRFLPNVQTYHLRHTSRFDSRSGARYYTFPYSSLFLNFLSFSGPTVLGVQRRCPLCRPGRLPSIRVCSHSRSCSTSEIFHSVLSRKCYVSKVYAAPAPVYAPAPAPVFAAPLAAPPAPVIAAQPALGCATPCVGAAQCVAGACACANPAVVYSPAVGCQPAIPIAPAVPVAPAPVIAGRLIPQALPGSPCEPGVECTGGSVCSVGVCLCPPELIQEGTVCVARTIYGVVPPPVIPVAPVVPVALGAPCAAPVMAAAPACVPGAVCSAGVCQCAGAYEPLQGACIRRRL